MKLLIIRHGDPDYTIDSLTETGWQEARLLADRLVKLPVRDFFVSPLGRAKDTASCTLERLGRTASVCDWLQEFPPKVLHPGCKNDMPGVAWDWLPAAWTAEPRFYDPEAWKTVPIMQENQVGAIYDHITEAFDALLAKYGYERNGLLYHAVAPNNDTLVFFCHFGLECVLLSHLLHISPMILWHGFAAAPTSVTTVVTEERRPGIASFRVLQAGDISHLYTAGQEPSFSARFRECYTNEQERLD